jgi:hypothetical protein
VRFLLLGAASLLLVHAVRGESLTVRIQETAVVEIPGATAAYTTNPLIADATIVAIGRVSVTGHSSGTTQLMVINAGGMQSYLVTVAAPPVSSDARPEAGAPLARYDGRYSSGGARMQNTFDFSKDDDTRRSELHVLHIHDLRAGPGRPRDAVASIFYRHTSAGRRLTLLDERVDVSLVTISNTLVRGLHLQQGPLELHGGYATSTMFDTFFLPAERRWVGGAGYGIDFHSTRWTPSVYGFFSQPDGTAARRGVVGALTAEHRRGDTLFVRGEVGVSRSLAAAGEIRFASPRGQLRAFVSLKPDDYPTLGLADLPGEHAELDWSRRAGDRLSITSYGTFDRFDVAALRQTIGAGSFGLGYAVTSRLAIHGGADISVVRTPATSIRTIGLPLGLAYEASAYGVGATYRLLDNSTASRRGDALRLNAHAGRGRFTANAWAERQRQAPTLELIFSAEPGLELALLRLGISIRTPEDVARALRDNAALIDLGFITGVNVDLTPRRLQAGLNLGWLGSGARSDHFRLLAVYGHDESIDSTRDSLIGTLTYSRRVLTATDLYGSYTWWRAGLAAHPESGSSVDVGLRQQFTGLPAFLRRSGTIGGFAFLDPEMRGVRGQGTMPLPDIVVTLDGSSTARTDATGAYAFHHVPPGRHRVAVQLPPSPRAFFTTPSHAETAGAARIDFGLVWAAARIDGRVVSDAGTGVQGVILSTAAPSGTPIGATSDAEGRFVFAVPPGTFRVGLNVESLPAGYSLAGERERTMTVEADQPQRIAFEVAALRSIAGRAVAASEVRIESLSRKTVADAEGNFVFRSMPSGTFTITARGGGRTVSATVMLPAGPAIVRDVILGAPPSAVVVQAGAFRDDRNAARLLGRLQRKGEQPFTVAAHGLTLVCVGPFDTRQEAVAASERLRRGGFDTFVTRR